MQNKFRSLIFTSLAAAGFGLIASAVAVPGKADSWDKETYVTIHDRVIAGDKVLEPGTYVWKLLDSQSDRHIVQIFDKDQTHLEETILAIPNYRLQPTGHSTFAFWETPPGVPKAVRAWFYPGDNFGQEFQYPKKLVAQFASAAPAPIPMAYKESEPAPAASPAPNPAAAAAQPAPTPEPQPAQDSSNNDAANASPQPAPAALPHTASNIPLILFFGFASFSLWGLLSVNRRRV
jgi:pyruvate/2-oxoglutarate dehydrogenase complex dihydrolipoamide acyltransferase (E2) component